VPFKIRGRRRSCHHSVFDQNAPVPANGAPEWWVLVKSRWCSAHFAKLCGGNRWQVKNLCQYDVLFFGNAHVFFADIDKNANHQRIFPVLGGLIFLATTLIWASQCIAK